MRLGLTLQYARSDGTVREWWSVRTSANQGLRRNGPCLSGGNKVRNDDGNHDYDDRDNERRVAALVAR